MNKIYEAIKKVGTFFVATVDEGGQPRVRPFDSLMEYEGKVYICTSNTKKCYAQMAANPKVEISGMNPDETWIRVSATLVRDDRDEVRAAMLEANPVIKRLYHIGDGIFEVLYLKDPVCTQYSLSADPIEIK